MKTKTEKENVYLNWKKLIQEQESSGVTQAEFCKQRNIVLSNFYYYHRKFKNKKNNGRLSPPLVPVQLNSSSSRLSSERIQLNLPNRMECHFPADLSISRVKQLLEVFLSC